MKTIAALAAIIAALLTGCATAQPQHEAPAPATVSAYTAAEQEALHSLGVAADSPKAPAALHAIRDLCTVIARGELSSDLTGEQAGAVYALCPTALSPRM